MNSLALSALSCAILAAHTGAAVQAPAPTAVPESRLIGDNQSHDDQFGWAVAASGATVVAGAPKDDASGTNSGSAYAFVRDGTTWTQQARLNPPDGAAHDAHGVAVAVDGDHAVVGAFGDDDSGASSGSVHVFFRAGTTWSHRAKLLAGDGAAGDQFGNAVSIDGDTVLVGSWGDGDAGAFSGSAYVFVRSGTTWSQQAKLTAADADAGDVFGCSVSLREDTALVGAYQDDDLGNRSGAAYVFVRSGTAWTQEAKLLPGDGGAEQYFGYAVAVSRDRALVGAPQDDDLGFRSGSVYVFERAGQVWTEAAKLLADDGTPDDYFGQAVSTRGAVALVGARLYFGSDGAAYLYERRGGVWDQVDRLYPQDGGNTGFGSGVAVSGELAVVGAWLASPFTAFSGAAYAYRLRRAETYCTPKVNSLGCTPFVGFTGIPTAVASSGFEVLASNVRNQKVGIVVYGVDGPAAAPFAGGTLCVGAPVRRSTLASSGGSPVGTHDCSGLWRLDLNAFAAGALGGNPHPELRVPGTLVHCQWWGRDPGASSGSALSDGVRYQVVE